MSPGAVRRSPQLSEYMCSPGDHRPGQDAEHSQHLWGSLILFSGQHPSLEFSAVLTSIHLALLPLNFTAMESHNRPVRC